MKPYYMKSLDEYQGNRQYDAFFCANGLEGRDTRVVKLFQKKMFKVKKWVVFDYAERVAEKDEKEENMKMQSQIFNSSGGFESHNENDTE